MGSMRADASAFASRPRYAKTDCQCVIAPIPKRQAPLDISAIWYDMAIGYNAPVESRSEQPMALVPIILSGGAGTRLWPLSRETAPKPFLTLPDGETLLAKTIMLAVALPNTAALITVTNRDYYFHNKGVYASPGVPPPQVVYLLEPFGRNTAAAVALAAMYVEATLGADSTLLVLRADHLIRD